MAFVRPLRFTRRPWSVGQRTPFCLLFLPNYFFPATFNSESGETNKGRGVGDGAARQPRGEWWGFPQCGWGPSAPQLLPNASPGRARSPARHPQRGTLSGARVGARPLWVQPRIIRTEPARLGQAFCPRPWAAGEGTLCPKLPRREPWRRCQAGVRPAGQAEAEGGRFHARRSKGVPPGLRRSEASILRAFLNPKWKVTAVAATLKYPGDKGPGECGESGGRPSAAPSPPEPGASVAAVYFGGSGVRTFGGHGSARIRDPARPSSVPGKGPPPTPPPSRLTSEPAERVPGAGVRDRAHSGGAFFPFHPELHGEHRGDAREPGGRGGGGEALSRAPCAPAASPIQLSALCSRLWGGGGRKGHKITFPFNSRTLRFQSLPTPPQVYSPQGVHSLPTAWRPDPHLPTKEALLFLQTRTLIRA